MFVETMGRNSGFIALHGGIAGGGDVILIPEIAFSVERLVHDVKDRLRRGKAASLVVVAEGAVPVGGEPIYQGRDARRLGGIANSLAEVVEERSGLECRAIVLGHLQRGGTPTAFDRVLATRFGAMAAQLVVEGRFDHMAALRGPEVVAVSLEEAVASIRRVDPEGPLVRTARAVGTSFGEPLTDAPA